jgi:hypothetical protein
VLPGNSQLFIGEDVPDAVRAIIDFPDEGDSPAP